jgi:thiosulfate/3-mercaptopyruvate sulfurtransferase
MYRSKGKLLSAPFPKIARLQTKANEQISVTELKHFWKFIISHAVASGRPHLIIIDNMPGLRAYRFSAGCLPRHSYHTSWQLLHYHRQVSLPSNRRSMSHIVSPRDLHKALNTTPSTHSLEPQIIPLCAAWFPASDPEGRMGIQVFREKRIPKARFFDLDKVIDKHSPYPHMLPGVEGFAASMSELGIRKNDILVVYDTIELGVLSAPRVGWMLRTFSHPKVHILNNFRLWVGQDLPTEHGKVHDFGHSNYPVPRPDKGKLATFEEIREATMDYNKEGREGIQVLDSRPSNEFSGMHLASQSDFSGHMPGSINIPYNLLLDPETKAFLPPDQLKKLFEMKGVDPLKPIISSGTSISAYVLETALNEAQFGSPDSRKVYDGSWSEWTQRVRPGDYMILKEQHSR